MRVEEEDFFPSLDYDVLFCLTSQKYHGNHNSIKNLFSSLIKFLEIYQLNVISL